MRLLPILLVLAGCAKSAGGHGPADTTPQLFDPAAPAPNTEPHPVGAIDYRGPPDGPVKNVVLVISDGTGLTHLSAGMIANRNQLVLENFDVVGLQKTHSSGLEITDSSAAATAIATGHKTVNQAVGVDAEGNPVPTLIERAEQAGLATGMVVSSEILHGTPAAFATHVASRRDYDAIARQMATAEVDVLIGTGTRWFTQHPDGDLTAAMAGRGYTVVHDDEALAAVDALPVLALMADEREPYRVEGRGRTLRSRTEKALELLGTHEPGFFLLVEASQVDWGGHDNRLDALVGEVLDLDDTLEGILRFAVKHGDTLVIVTADHETGGLALPEANAATGRMEGVFVTTGHTATMVPVFAWGPSARTFSGIYDNTAIHDRIVQTLGWSEGPSPGDTP